MVEMSKTSRWRLFSHRDDAAARPQEPPPSQEQLDDDVNAFLKPSTDRAQQQRDAAAHAFLASASRPRIDVGLAQRWPGAQDILKSAAAGGKSPGPGGLRTSGRKKGLTVSFVRAVPEVIGHGGDECEEPAAEVSLRKRQQERARAPPEAPEKPQDDAGVGTGLGRTPSQAEQRNSLTRTLTSHGELSPPLGRKLEMGHINAQAHAPPPLPQRLGPMGLGERPRPLERAPTGFDVLQPAADARRPSNDSEYSQDSDATSPVLARKTSHVEPTIREEDPDDDAFRPKPMSRTQTGFRGQLDAPAPAPAPAPAVPAMPPRLPEMHLVSREDDSPLDGSAMLADRFLQSEPAQPESFSARVKQRMRADEGRALHEAAQRQSQGLRRDSDSSAQSPEPLGRTPPQAPPVLPPRASPAYQLVPEDPHRSRARGPSPARKAAVHGAPPLDMEARPPSSASSQYTSPSAASQARGSPAMRSEPFAPPSAAAVQRMPSNSERTQAASVQRLPSNAERGPPASGPLGRADTKSLGEAAYKEFAERVIHMRGIFALTAQLGGQLYDRTPLQWLRVATWWFLRGRTGMESLIRSRPRNPEPQPERLTQAHVDLAKVLWMLDEVLPNHPALQQYQGRAPEAQADLARQLGDAASAEVFDIHAAIFHYMKLLVGSMKKHQSMPPTQALIQGQDQSIWTEYPPFAPDAASVLSAGVPKDKGDKLATLSQCIPLSDTKSDFCYFRMFVKASMSTDDPNTDRAPMSVVISVLRPKDQFQVKLAICSQNDLVNIILGPGLDGGPSWDEVNWKKQSNQISVHLRHGFTLNLELSEGDWRTLFSIVDHTNRVQMDLRERRDEHALLQLQLRDASYRDPASSGAFPQERVRGCKLMVFEKVERSSEGTGKRRLHRGYRVALVTPQNNKQVSLVNHEVGTNQNPMNFEYVSEPDQAPAMRLHFREEGPDKRPRVCTAHLVFHESKERNQLFGTFTAMNINPGETTFAQLPLKAFHIESADQAEGFSQQGSRVLEKLQWQEAKVINQDPEAAGLESAPTVMSESLRIVCRHTAGIVADRMNLGPGELLIRLPIDGAAELTLLRNAQQDLTVAIDATRTERDTPDALGELLRTLTAASTIRKLTFNSFKDLHAFQYAVTGFAIKFDGIASTFSISRRRMVVPIYKQWTANTIRVQVVEQDNILQLLAFFEDFSHADAMNFQLRVTDTFEKTDKGGKFGLKLVDAKFALPVEERRGEGKMQKEEGRLTGWAGTKRKFVCLDEIEYPGEHDDILIQFDHAETRDMFAAALPSATMERKFTLRRKI